MRHMLLDLLRWPLGRLLLLGALLSTGCATTLVPPEGVSLYGNLSSVQSPTLDDLRKIRAQQIFIQGMTTAIAGDHRAAIELFEEVLRLEPDAPAVLSALAESHEATNNHRTALFYAKRALQRAPDNPYYYEHLAELHLEDDDPNTAILVYQAMLERFPQDLDARYELARLQAITGNLQEALASYEQIIRHAGDNLQVRYQMLEIYTMLHDLGGIVETVEAMLSLSPDDTMLLRMAAEIYTEHEQPQQATRVLEQLVRQQPQDLEAAMMLADLYRQQGESEKAEAVISQANQIEDLAPSFLTARAAALYLRSDADQDAARTAEQLLERSLETDPDQPDALFMLGDLRYRAGDFQAAADLLARGVEKDPRNPQAWLQAAAAYLQSDNAARALEIAEDATLLFPGQFAILRLAAYAALEASSNAMALRYFEQAVDVHQEEAPEDHATRAEMQAAVGLIYARMKEYERSDSAYAEAIASNPDHAMALNNYAYSLAERDRQLDKALEMARHAVNLDPENASYLDTLGWVYFKMGQLNEAAEWIHKSLETGRASATVHEHYGDIQYQLGHQEEALRYWKKSLEMNPDNPDLESKINNRP